MASQGLGPIAFAVAENRVVNGVPNYVVQYEVGSVRGLFGENDATLIWNHENHDCSGST
jgi:hypothetical protein